MVYSRNTITPLFDVRPWGYGISNRLLFYSSDEDEVAKLLLDSGAKINTLNGKGATPLIIAAVKGHYSVLRVLANHSSVKLHEQVCTVRRGINFFFIVRQAI